MNQRLQRLCDQIQRNLSAIIRDKINDPRLQGFLVTVSGVKVSPDLGYADIYITAFAAQASDEALLAENTDAVAVLNKAAGFLRTELAQTLNTRTTPRLRFHYDKVTANANRMMALVGEAMQKTAHSAQAQSDDASDDVAP